MTLPAFWTDPWRYHETAGKERNHLYNPSFQLPTDGLAKNWTQDFSTTPYDVYNTQVAGEQRVQFWGGANDTNVSVYPLFSNSSAVGTAAPGDIWTGTMSVHGSAAGCQVLLVLAYNNSAGVQIETTVVPITLGGALTRKVVTTGGPAPPNTSSARLSVKVTGIDNGDTFNLYAANATLMKIAAPLPVYPDPNLPGAHWEHEWCNSISAKELCYPVDGKWVLEDTSNAHGTNIYGPGQAVTPGSVCDVSVLVEVLAQVYGTFRCDLCFFNAYGDYLLGVPIVNLSGNSAEAWHSAAIVAPATAASARPHFAWAPLGGPYPIGYCKATIAGARLGGTSLKARIDAINAKADAGAQTLVHGPVGDTTSYACVHSPRVGYPRDDVALTTGAAFVVFAPVRSP